MNKRAVWVFSLVALGLAGCAADNVIFITKTGTNIFDIDTAPGTVGIGYNRVEGYIGPRLENGSAPPVAGWISTKGDLLSREIRQVYATGLAADRITVSENCKAPDKNYTPPKADEIDPCAALRKPSVPLQGSDDKSKTMVAGTSTSAGLRIGVDASNPTMHFGYLRKEISVIPLGSKPASGNNPAERVYPSVIAMFSNDTSASAGRKSEFGIAQFFATGVAADNLASDDSMRKQFRQMANDSIDEFKEAQREQQRTTLGLLNCFTKMDDAKLDGVWNSAKGLNLYSDEIDSHLRSLKEDKKKARSDYVAVMTVIRADSGAHGIRLEQHRQEVCKLATGG